MLVEPWQTGVGPVIAQLGLLTSTVLLQVVGQVSRVALSVTVKLPAVAPARTWMEGPVVEPTILPSPVMVQL